MNTDPLNLKKKFNIHSGFLPLILTCLLGVVIYSNTFQSPFVFDDTGNIVNNPAIKNISDLGSIWKFSSMRFITNTSLAVNYYFHQLDLFGYHLVNLIIHICAALMVRQLVLLIFSTPEMVDKKIAPYGRWLALFSGLLFVVHPVQTEGVTYIIQRSTALAAFFYVSSLCAYIKARLEMVNGTGSGSWKWWYGLSILSVLLGMFSKTTAFTLPLMILTVEFCFFGAKKFKWRYATPFLILMIIVPLNVALSKKTGLWQIDQLTTECENIPRGWYLLTQFRVIVTYLRLLFIPLNQNLDYYYPISRTLWHFPTAGSFLLLLSILSAAIILFRRYRLISFSIFWFFLSLSVESSIIPIRDVIFEHRLYLPMVGYCIFLPAVLYYLCRDRNLKIVIYILTMIVCFYSSLTYMRNWVWQSEFALWDDTVSKSPDKFRPYNNRGVSYLKAKMYNEALLDFNRALEINPKYSRTYYNKGNLYRYIKDYNKALYNYNRALKLDPYYVEAYNNRGIVYATVRDFDKAISDYNMALEYDPDHAEVYNNRGFAYAENRDFDKAFADYNRALELKPDYANAYNNRGVVYREQGKYGQAIADFNKALECENDYVEAYGNRGVTYTEKGDFNKAILDYAQALLIEPGNAMLYNNRGLIYYYIKDYDKALSDFNAALDLKNNYAEAYNNRAVVLFRKKEYSKAGDDIKKARELGYEPKPKFLEDLRNASTGENK